MQQNFPDYIRNEKDLMHYERHLKNMCSTDEINTDKMHDFKTHLKGCLGKYVRVESFIGNRMMCRMGVLTEVCEDHIVIKPSKAIVTVMIPIESVKYVTIIHGGKNYRCF